MKLLKPFNLIMFVLIPIIMFFGFSLRSYANGVFNATFNIKNSSTSYSDNNYKCTVDLSGNPNFTLSKDTNSISYSGDYIYATLKVTTSEGTFDIKSSRTNISSSTSSSNLGFNNLGSITLPGYFINLYVDYSSGTYKGGDYSGTENGSFYSGTGGNSYNGNEFGTFTSTYDMARISAIGNSSYGNYSNIVLSSSDNVNFEYYYGYNYNQSNPVNDLNYIFNSYIPINFTVNSTSNWSYDLIGIMSNGGQVICKSGYFNSSTTSVSTSASVSTFYRINYLYLYVKGVSNYSDVTFNTISFSHNLISSPTYEQSSWSTIGSSDELADLGDTSTSIEDTLEDNNTFEESAFNSLDDRLDEYDFDGWSVIPGQGGMYFATDLINKYYNLLPFKVQWLITTVISFGLISMLLTVGTRVIQRTGEFTRARPIRVSEKHIYHHKSK